MFIGVHVFVICVYTGMHEERYAHVCAHIGVCIYGCIFRYVCIGMDMGVCWCEYGCV